MINGDKTRLGDKRRLVVCRADSARLNWTGSAGRGLSHRWLGRQDGLYQFAVVRGFPYVHRDEIAWVESIARDLDGVAVVMPEIYGNQNEAAVTDDG
jgi:hypothetical protein